MEGKAKTGISPTRAEDFPQWFQSVVRDAEVAELDHVRGAMVIRPWGYGIWELMQRSLDDAIKETGAVNAYFPLLHPTELLRGGGEARRGLRQGDGGGHAPPARAGPGRVTASGRRAPRAADRPPHLRDDHRPLLREVDQLLPRPAADDQPVVQHRPLGAAAARPSAHHGVSLAGGPYRPRHRGGGARGDPADAAGLPRVHREPAGDPGDRGREARVRALPGRGDHSLDRGDDAGRQGAAVRDLPLPRPELLPVDEHGVHRRGR